MKGEIELGDKVKDKVTGFEGIAVAKIEYLNGCVQFGVKAQVTDAALKEAEYIDVGQLEYIDEGINEPEIEEKPFGPGGEMPDAPGRGRKCIHPNRLV